MIRLFIVGVTFFAITSLFGYGLLSIVTWELNPNNWAVGWRIFWAAFTAFFTIILTGTRVYP